ncbi:MAG: hypothetical protein AMXMBFR76_08060 [Pseudomonadota bacterium]
MVKSPCCTIVKADGAWKPETVPGAGQRIGGIRQTASEPGYRGGKIAPWSGHAGFGDDHVPGPAPGGTGFSRSIPMAWNRDGRRRRPILRDRTWRPAVQPL